MNLSKTIGVNFSSRKQLTVCFSIAEMFFQVNGVAASKLEDLNDIILRCSGRLQLVASRHVGVVTSPIESQHRWAGQASPSFDPSGNLSFLAASALPGSTTPSQAMHLVDSIASIRSPSLLSLGGSSIHQSHPGIECSSAADMQRSSESIHERTATPTAVKQSADRPDEEPCVVVVTGEQGSEKSGSRHSNVAPGVGAGEAPATGTNATRRTSSPRVLGAVVREASALHVEDEPPSGERKEEGSKSSLEEDRSVKASDSDDRTVERQVEARVRLPRKRRQSVLTTMHR